MVNITSTIKFTEDDTNQVSGTYSSSIVGRSTPSNPPIVGEMVIDFADSKKWILDDITGPAFNVDLIALIDITAVDNIKAIHIQCVKVPTTAQDKSAPVRFEVEITDGINTMNLGKMSQFQLTNSEGFTQTGLVVKNVAVGSEEKASLVVVFALKTS